VEQHLSKYFPNAFTGKANDWVIYLYCDNLGYVQARKIERHIKRMKSKKFIENLARYPEIMDKLIALYQT